MNRFVIMLDDLIDIITDGWPVTAEDDNLDALRQVTQFSGNPIIFSPRSNFSLRFVESKSLVFATRPLEDHKGGIYERIR